MFDANRQFIYDYVDIKEPGAYDVLAAFALATWRFEDWQSYPFLSFVGHYGAGKTTAQRVLKQICRRAVGGPSITVPAYVSMMDRFSATLFPDEAQTIQNEENSELIAILRGAYQKDNLRIKSIQVNGMWTDKASKAYGFCVLASHDPIEEGIAQRCLPFTMSKRTRHLEKWRKPEFLLRGSHIRDWNLQYRFQALGRDDVDDDLLEQIHDDRLQELALPLLTVAPAKARDSILSFFKGLERRKHLELESGEEADYFRALDWFTKHTEFIKPGGRISFAAFKQELLEIKKEADSDFDVKYLPGPKTMWKILERLGFHHGGYTREGSTISFDVSQVEALRPRFSDTITLSPVSSTPSTPFTSIENDAKDVKEVKDTGVKHERNPSALEPDDPQATGKPSELVWCKMCRSNMTRKDYIQHECPVGETLADVM